MSRLGRFVSRMFDRSSLSRPPRAPAPEPCAEPLESRVLLASDQPVVGVNLGAVRYWQPEWIFRDAFQQAGDWTWDWLRQDTGAVVQGEESDHSDPDPTLDSKGWPVSLATWTIEGVPVRQRLKTYIYKDIGEGHFPVGTYHATWLGDATLRFAENAIVKGPVQDTPTSDGIEHSVDFEVKNAVSGITVYVDNFTPGTNHLRNVHVYVPDPSQPGKSFYDTQHGPWYPGAPFSPFHPQFEDHVRQFPNIRFMEWGDTNRVQANSWEDRRTWDSATQAWGKSDSVKKGVAYEYWVELANRLQKDLWICIPHTFSKDTLGNSANDHDVEEMAKFFHARLNPNLKVYLEWSNEIWNDDFNVNTDMKGLSKIPGTNTTDWNQFWNNVAELIKRDFGTWKGVYSAAGDVGRLVRVVAGQASNPYILSGLLSRLNNPALYEALACGGYAGADITNYNAKAEEMARVAYNAVPGAVARVRWNMDVRDDFTPPGAAPKPFLVYEGGQGLGRKPSYPSNLTKEQKDALEEAFKKEFFAAQTSETMRRAYRDLMQGMSELKLDLFSHFTMSGKWDLTAYGARRWMDQSTPKYDTLTATDLYFPDFRVDAIQPIATESNDGPATFRIWRSGHLDSGATVRVTFHFTPGQATDFTASATALTFGPNDQYKDVTITPVRDSVPEQDEKVTLTLDDGASYNIDPEKFSANATIVDDDDGWTRLPPVAVQNAEFSNGLLAGNGWTRLDFNYENGVEIEPDEQDKAPKQAAVTNAAGDVYLAPATAKDAGGWFAWASGNKGRSDPKEVQYLTQQIDVSAQRDGIDTGMGRILGTAWVAGGGYRWDNGMIKLRFLDGSGNYIPGTEAEGKKVSTFQQWLPSIVDAGVPRFTRKIEIQLRSQNLPGDTNQNVGFDAVSAVLRFPSLPSVSVAAPDSKAAETNADTGTFTISRSSSTGSLTVNYTVAGTATSGTDYNDSPAFASSVTFSAGQSSKTFTVTPLDDASSEGDEQVTLTLSPGTGYTISSGSATVTIADNDAPPPSGGIVANFSGGMGFTGADQYRGAAGQGWLNGWGLISYNDRIVMQGDQTQTAAPLNSGGTYLNAPLVPNSTGTDVRTATLFRPYASANGVDTSRPYRIEFDYRLDSPTTTFTGIEDRVNLFGDHQYLYGTGPTNTWSVVAVGTAAFGTRARTWGFGTGNWPSNTPGNQLVDTGVALVSGRVYHITIDNDPAAHKYKASITDGTSSFQSGTLGWRPSATNYGNSTPTYVHYGAHVDGATEGLTFSLDSVRITPAGQTQTLAPTDDAHVVGGAFAPNNNGSSVDLAVKYNATFDDQKKEAYLKFNTSSVTGTVNSAKLKLYGRIQDTSATNVQVSAYAVSSTTWTEGTLTWNNKPLSTGAALATVTVSDSVSRWYEFDLTKYVQDQRRLGNNVFSIVLKTATQTQPTIYFSAKETTGTTFDPQLVVQTGSTTSGAVRAVQDALVTAGTSSAQNYGTLTDLRVKLNNNYPELTRNTFLMFDASALPDGVLGSVKLRLCGQLNGTGSTNLPISVFPVADTSWLESTITWDTRPLPDTSALDTETIIDDTERWYEWDVTGYVNQQRAAGKTLLSFALAADDESIPYALFCSHEAAANGPELVGTVSSGTSVAATNDARVNAGASSGANYGQAPDLIVKQNAAFPDQTRESYLSFDTTGVAGTLQSVKLRLNGRMEDTRAGNVAVSAYGVSDTSWSEDSLTWDTKPAAGTAALASATVTDDVSRWYEWDLTAYVNQERAAGRTVVCIVLKTATETPNKIIFNSAEAAADRPELLMIA